MAQLVVARVPAPRLTPRDEIPIESSGERIQDAGQVRGSLLALFGNHLSAAAAPERVRALRNEGHRRDPVDPRECLQLDDVDAPLTGLALRHKRLRLAKPTRGFELRHTRPFTRLSEPPEKCCVSSLTLRNVGTRNFGIGEHDFELRDGAGIRYDACTSYTCGQLLRLNGGCVQRVV